MQDDWFMYHLRSTYKNRPDFPFNRSKYNVPVIKINIHFFKSFPRQTWRIDTSRLYTLNHV